MRCCAPLEHRLEAGAQRQRRLAGAGAAAERDDADVGVEQQVERDALLGAAAVHAEGLAVAAHEPHLLVGRDPAQRAAPFGQQHETGVARQLAGLGDVEHARSAYSASTSAPAISSSAMPVQPDSTCSARYSCAVQPDARGLDAQRHVLADQDDVGALGGEVARDREHAACRCPPSR